MLHKTKTQISNRCCIILTIAGKLNTRIHLLTEAWDVVDFVSAEIFMSKGGAVVRALASHKCGPGSNPGVEAICGLSLLLVLFLAPREFSTGSLVFPLSLKTNTSKFQFNLECTDTLESEFLRTPTTFKRHVIYD